MDLREKSVAALVALLVLGTSGWQGSTPGGTTDHALARPPVVRTEGGPVRGSLADGYQTFQGIPYAAPPVGSRRWAPPAPLVPWSGVRDATRPGPGCPQSGSFLGDPAGDDEDCLHLNITTPQHRAGQRLPVMFWIHGGGFYFGSGAGYGAKRLATRGNVVVVTLNYRLGALGFLAHPSLDGTQRDLSGNYGLQDQQAAMRWVHRNIARFGGDASRMTVFGESAGAVSTCAQLASPSAAGLFARAIVQSGPCAETDQWPHVEGYWFARPRARAERQGVALASSLGCGRAPDVAACLRAVPAAKVLAASDGGGYGPAAGGGNVLPVLPARAIRTGAFNQVPVMHGTNKDEHSTFIWAIEQYTGHDFDATDYEKMLDDFFGADDARRVRTAYPLTDYSSPSLALSTLFSDYSWGCTAIGTDDRLSRYVPTFAYEFADENPPWGKDMPPAHFPTGALHVGELQYLFDDPEFPGPLSGAQTRLSRTMIDYWTTFAHSGDPNSRRTPSWASYVASATTPSVQSLAPGHDGVRPVDLGSEHRCGFWHSLGRGPGAG